MKNLKRVMALFAIFIVIVSAFSCTTHAEIEEYTTVAKYCDDTYYVGTRVWVRDWKGFAISLEMWEQEKVKYSSIDSVRELQKVMADSCFIRIERCLKH